jgi:hypothetical protein
MDEDVNKKKEGLGEHVEAFAETLLKLVFAKLAGKIAILGAGLVNTFFLCLALIFVLLFAAAGLAWWLGDIIHHRAGGFFIVAGGFLLIICILLLIRKSTILPRLRNQIVRKLYE